ncbi:hypothetical protein BHM03_00027329 [Ensete ventricosum]|nr:hypothetical protein BHM03_00027329 [Ensete ventricosum]
MRRRSRAVEVEQRRSSRGLMRLSGCYRRGGTRLPKFGSFSHPGHYRGRGRDFGLLKLGSLGCPGANKDEAEA